VQQSPDTPVTNRLLSSLDTKPVSDLSKKSQPDQKKELPYKLQLKQNTILWAEYLYREYKREKSALGEDNQKPTHHDDVI